APPDDSQNRPAAGGGRDPHGRDPRDQPGSGRGGPNPLYGGGVLPSLSSQEVERPVHGDGLPHLCHGDPIPRCGSDQAHPLRDRFCAFSGDLRSELYGHMDPLPHPEEIEARPMTPPPDRPPLAGPMPRRSGAWSGGGVTRALAIKDLRIVAGNETLLRPVSFDIRPGEILAIIGPAGSGK